MNCRNNITLIGNLGKDCELRTFESGSKKATLSLATTDSYTNNKGETVQTTDWHNCESWGKQAESMERLLKKGMKVAVQGSLHNDKYEDKDGNTRYRTYVRVNSFEVMNPKSEKAQHQSN